MIKGNFMHSTLLKDIYLGINDGKKEALYRNDFENFFFDYQNIYEQAIRPEKYIILGKKGSGKTILAEYINKKSFSNSNWFSEIRSYKDFQFHELIHLKSNDIQPNEYISIWEWVILIDLARQLLKDNGIGNTKLKSKLEQFFKDNYYSVSIDSKKVVEITKQNKIKGSILKIGGEHSGSQKLTESSYINYLEDLREVVITLISESESQYTIFYDELDDRFRNDEYYKNSIISLIKATDKINILLLERGLNSKIYLLLRTDIFHVLNDPDLNKLRMVNAVLIDWGNKVKKNSPLIELVLFKAQRSVPEFQKTSLQKLFYDLFPQDVKRIKPERFLLERTLFRPRDVITYLNLIIEQYPNSKYFGWKGFIDLKQKYSEYFLQEIRNELSGHLPDTQIDEAILMLKQFSKSHFTYSDIEKYHKEHKSNFPNVDIVDALKIFFKFNIVGNKWFNNERKKTFYCWAHRDNKAEIDFDKEILIHLGLREELSM